MPQSTLLPAEPAPQRACTNESGFWREPLGSPVAWLSFAISHALMATWAEELRNGELLRTPRSVKAWGVYRSAGEAENCEADHCWAKFCEVRS